SRADASCASDVPDGTSSIQSSPHSNGRTTRSVVMAWRRRSQPWNSEASTRGLRGLIGLFDEGRVRAFYGCVGFDRQIARQPSRIDRCAREALGAAPATLD